MRRLFAVLIASALLLSLAAPVAAQGKPIKTDLDPEVLGPEVFAGTCPFPVQLVDTFASSRMFEFPPDRHGNERLVFTGGFHSVITNLDTGESIEVRYFGRLEYTFRPDGTVDLRGSGGVLHWYTAAEADLSALGQGLFLGHGRFEQKMDAATFEFLEPGTFRGSVRDLCAELAG